MITLVAAVGNNGEIGLNGKLPWHCPAELDHFHRTVADMVTVCGVNTYPTLPKALRARTLVWSGRGWGDKPTVNTDEVLSLAQMQPIAIIGGAATYAAFMPYADKMVLSYIRRGFDADTFFPDIVGTADYSWVWHCLQGRATCPQSGLHFDVWEVTKVMVQP